MKALSEILFTAIKYLFLIIFVFIFILIALYLSFPYFSKIFYVFGEKQKAVELGRNLTETKSTIIAVGAHPDDIEWWAGGSLANARENGARVVLIIATDSYNSGFIRRKEQMRAAEILGYCSVYFLGYPDGKLSEFDEAKIRERILEIFEIEKPEIIVTFDVEKPAKIYRHTDHLVIGRASLAAAKSFGVKAAFLFHTSSPNAVVDISKFISKRLKAYSSHESQQGRIFSSIFKLFIGKTDLTPATYQLRRISRMFGKEYGYEYAEIFRVINLTN